MAALPNSSGIISHVIIGVDKNDINADNQGPIENLKKDSMILFSVISSKLYPYNKYKIAIVMLKVRYKI
jgi:hypothetical protein